MLAALCRQLLTALSCVDCTVQAAVDFSVLFDCTVQAEAVAEKIGYSDSILNDTALNAEYAGVSVEYCWCVLKQ